MLPYQVIEGGTFTSPADPARVNLQVSTPDFDEVEVRCIDPTVWGLDNTAAAPLISYWYPILGQDSAEFINQVSAAPDTSSFGYTASNGIRLYDTTNPPLFAALPGTVVSQANFAQITMADTGSIQVGDIVQIYDATDMQQISGYRFAVVAVTNDTSIDINIDSSTFLAPGTDVMVLPIIPGRFYPRWRYIVPYYDGANHLAGITQAAQAVVSFSEPHDFTVGEYVSFRVPSVKDITTGVPIFGMTEINNKKAIVVSVTEFTITVDLNTSGFQPFTFPDSADVVDSPYTPAIVVPAGAGPIPNANPPGVSVNDAADNRNMFILSLGTDVVTQTGKLYWWRAIKFDKSQTSSL